jgi:hypothetical protein
MFGAGVLDAKIVYHHAEKDGPRLMFEESWRMFKLVVAVLGEIGNECVIGDAARL